MSLLFFFPVELRHLVPILWLHAAHGGAQHLLPLRSGDGARAQAALQVAMAIKEPFIS